MTQYEAETLVTSNNGGSIDSSYGPFYLNDLEVWEVWVKNGAYDTRFATEAKNKSRQYFSNFQNLANYCDNRYHEVTKKDCATATDEDLSKKTMGWLLSNMKPSALWTVIATLVGALATVAAVAFKIGGMFGLH